MAGKLYLVATPIGNLGDISHRAVDTLSSADVIACEDTRHTRKLLNRFGITTGTVSYHEHNETDRAGELAKILEKDGSVAIVSDAGTPGINDPGHVIVQKAIDIGAQVIPVPGAAAFVSAAIGSGLATDSLFFGGFLPSKKTERRKRLEEIRSIPATLIFYEAPHRILASLSDCLDILGDRQAAIARELTKLHEEFLRGKISFMISAISSAKPRGEYVLVFDRERKSGLERPDKDRLSLSERVAELERTGLDRRSALKKAAKEFGMTRSEAYRVLLSR